MRAPSAVSLLRRSSGLAVSRASASPFSCRSSLPRERAPVAGLIRRIAYKPGLFINADLDKASEDNERNSLLIEAPSGTYGIVQIAGLIARRIVPFVREGETDRGRRAHRLDPLRLARRRLHAGGRKRARRARQQSDRGRDDPCGDRHAEHAALQGHLNEWLGVRPGTGIYRWRAARAGTAPPPILPHSNPRSLTEPRHAVGASAGVDGDTLCHRRSLRKFHSRYIAAAILDGLDGRIARVLKGTSRFGAELDLLADFVDFGVAPGLILYLWIAREARLRLACRDDLCHRLRAAAGALQCQPRRARPARLAGALFRRHAGAGRCVVLAMAPMYLGFLGLVPDGKAAAALVLVWVALVAAGMVSRVPTFSGKTLGQRVHRDLVPPYHLPRC